MKNSLCKNLVTLFFIGSLSMSLIGAEKPNIVFIFIDDMGASAIGSYAKDFGNEIIVPTPNIDRIADGGIKFVNGYVTPQCTPSRATFLTGQYTARNKMWHVVPRYCYPNAYLKEPAYIENLPRETYTIAKALKDNGYKTAIMGKWHLSQWSLLEDDPDGYYVRLFNNRNHFYGFDVVDESQNLGGLTDSYHQRTDKGVDFLTDQTIKFIEQNKDTAFFVYLSHHTVHGPIMAPEELVQKYIDKGYTTDKEKLNSAYYLASIEHLDNSVGRILNKLDELEISDKTMVVFLTDNGGVDYQFDSVPLREGKGSPYEGGIRVPFMIKWPESIKAGTVHSTPVHIVDLYPTFVDIAGGEMKQDWILDGENLLPVLSGTGNINRDALYWYHPLYDMLWGAMPNAVIRKGDYKLLWHFADYYKTPDNEIAGRNFDMDLYSLGERIELFNLKEDVSEENDLSRIEVEKTNELLTDLKDWINDMQVQMPFKNPDYNHETALNSARDRNMCKMPPMILPHDDAIYLSANEEFKIDFDHYVSLDPDDPLTVSWNIAGSSDMPQWIEYKKDAKVIFGKPENKGKYKFLITISDKDYVVKDSVSFIVQ